MSPILAWTPNAWEDYLYWQAHDRRICKRINELLWEACRTPFSGKGKPEPLRHELAGCWSRRIDHQHRLVYTFDAGNDTLCVLQCRYHY
jgi:toxin YoeB